MEKRSLKVTKAAAGEMEIIRPSKLAEEGRTGVVATGVYEGSKPNKFDATKRDFFIRGDANKLIIINETQSLREQLSQLDGLSGQMVEVTYNGKLKTKNGKGYHDFEVSVLTAK